MFAPIIFCDTSFYFKFNFCSDHVDLQLPQISHFQPELPVFEEEEIPDINFKEKVVKSIAPAGGARNEPVAFKKRKIQKFNVRQRNDDDDE